MNDAVDTYTSSLLSECSILLRASFHEMNPAFRLMSISAMIEINFHANKLLVDMCVIETITNVHY